MNTRRIPALGLLLVLAAGPLAAQGFSPYAGWESIAEGVQERRLEEGRRVERIALGSAGLRWAVDRLRDEEDRWDRFAGPGDGDLAAEVLRLQWALDALEEFIAEDGEDEVEKALRRARSECDFAFQVASSAAGGVPQSWVYPFGIHARGVASWEAACGAQALVFTRVATEAAGSGIGSFRAFSWAASAPAAESVDLCLRRGIGAGCSAQARAQGFAPCRADILSAVAVPELAFYFEVEEIAVGCNSTPVYPDPAGY